MKLRIVQAGWKGFTGNFGGCEFVDAVSVEEMNTAMAQRLSAIIKCENVETGSNPSITQALLDAQNTGMSKDMAPMNTTNVSEAQATHAAVKKFVPYTRDMLMKIADEKGIAGLRAIADPVGLSGRKITDLISAILAKGVNSSVESAAPARLAGDDSNRPVRDPNEKTRLAPSVVAEQAAKAVKAPAATPAVVPTTVDVSPVIVPVTANPGTASPDLSGVGFVDERQPTPPAQAAPAASTNEITIVDAPPAAAVPVTPKKARITVRPAESVIEGGMDDEDITTVV